MAEIESHLTALGDLLAVFNGFGKMGEYGPHFRLALDVQLFGVHAHPAFVLQGLTGLDAQKHLLRRRVLPVQVVAVVGGYHGDARFLRNAHQPWQHGLFLRNAVIHQLNIVVIPAEKLLHMQGVGLGVVIAAFQQHFGQIAAQTGGQADQPLGVLLQQVVVDAGLIIEALGKTGADQLDEILIARVVFAQKDHMAVFPGRAAFFETIAADIDLAADDRGDAGVPAGVIKIHRAVHDAVVGDGGVGEAQLLQAADQRADAVGTVQQAVFGMQMQMGKGHERSPFVYFRVYCTTQRRLHTTFSGKLSGKRKFSLPKGKKHDKIVKLL